MRKAHKLFILLIFILLPFDVFADVGPKPSVNIKVSGINYSDKYYMTLLAEEKSTGPYSKERSLEYFPEFQEANLKFSKIKDKDGYSFLGYVEEMREDGNFSWSYYPPEYFKIAIFFPEKDLILISKKYNAYAFNSYYKMTFKDIDLASKSGTYYFSDKEIEITNNYNYIREVLLFLARVIITIGIEYLIAFVMFKPNKYQKNLIVKTNILTQIILNALLNIILYFYGFIFYFILMIPLEILVFVIEAYIYKKKLNKNLGKNQKEASPILYSFIANGLSAVTGYYFLYYFTFHSFMW